MVFFTKIVNGFKCFSQKALLYLFLSSEYESVFNPCIPHKHFSKEINRVLT